MIYECNLNGTPVSCCILEWNDTKNKCLIEYQDSIGPLRLWVDPAIIKGNAVPFEISQ